MIRPLFSLASGLGPSMMNFGDGICGEKADEVQPSAGVNNKRPRPAKSPGDFVRKWTKGENGLALARRPHTQTDQDHAETA